ncbi:nuclear transport factor 2 family protein (plasmid) [Streptomyces sp. FXJ1.172]|jgi:ketosteroid isomerase-like protein|uniref:nuclear transport factor 2 family protein n=1 Tax=Streptomyces sp. FXJ1.172 TaxID=710705 RepID=UPI0023DD0513|nr:nuclear transport factor 2 family protein [Streptomyces sp. FXJ1.172]WEP01031.1 nuclear transport factor 2 family protein [Streptomyces sp. FXJ1.172]
MDTTVMRYQEAMRKKSADALAALYAEDAVHEVPFTVPGFPPRFEGREAIRAAYGAMWSASPVVIDSVDTTALHRTSDEEVVVVEQHTRGHVGPEGPAFGVPSLLVLRIRAGLIVHCRDYMDGLAVAMARPGGLTAR